jgi:hypothetical protein
MATADRKLVSIRSILRNELWQQHSGLYQRLEIALNKLPADALADLNMLIVQKEVEAANRGHAGAADGLDFGAVTGR